MSPGCSSALLERLAELRGAGAQLRRGRRPLRPHPHRCAFAAERDQRVNRARRLDIEREPRAPDPLCRLDFAAAAVSRDLELRHRRSLRRRKWNFEIPSRRSRIACVRPAMSTRSGSEATCNRVWRAIAASVSPSRRCAVVASGASGAIDGAATACAEGSAPRNGGGGVLVWTVTFVATGISATSVHRMELADNPWHRLQHVLQQIQCGAGATARWPGIPQRARADDADGAAQFQSVIRSRQTRLRQKNFLHVPMSGDNEGTSVESGAAAVAGSTRIRGIEPASARR